MSPTLSTRTKCPYCDSDFTWKNLHIKPRYGESIFAKFVKEDPSFDQVISDLSDWLTSLFGTGASLCISEEVDGDVYIQGRVETLNNVSTTWYRRASIQTFLIIIKDKDLYTVLIDPKLTE